MSKKVILFTTLFTLVKSGTERQRLITDSAEIKAFLDHYNSQAEVIRNAFMEAAWNYNTDITEHNQQRMLNQELLKSKFNRESYINATKYNLAVMSPRDKRLFNKIMDIGTSAQNNETKLAYFYQLVSDMMTICSTASATFPSLGSLGLKPDSNDTASERYYLLLAHWVGSVATGDKIKGMYAEYVELSNEAVRKLGHADTGAYWRSWYETPTFEDDVRALFDQLRPLYEQLHAYARRKLKQIYGNDKFPSSGHIPAHLLGNWMNYLEILTPYEDKPSLDVTYEMWRQNYEVLDLFKIADDFFKSLGMIQMPESFWNKSLFEKPTDGREVICHASAWDFGNGKDFRIKQCARVTARHLDIIHHEIGHIEYFLQYKDLPILFRRGANNGFHEAVGDVISLSVQTPKHLNMLGLFPCVTDDDVELDINFLMQMALKLVAGLPFIYIIDKWRWTVFRGDTTPDRYNDEWWNLRGMYEGVSQPVSRGTSAFDPGSLFHVAADVPYVRYFVSKIVQFQFYKALCEKAGHVGPLHKCDIYNSKEAGTLLSEMLKLGSSKPWPEAMYLLTGQYKMDARPLMDYFKPLLEYLRQENGNDYGWHQQNPNPTSTQESVSHQNKAFLTFVFTTVTTAFISSYVF